MLEGVTEDNVLTLLCWSHKHAVNVTLQITPDVFSTRAYRRIAEKAFEYIELYKKPPREHLRDLLEKELSRGEEGSFLERIIGGMDQLQSSLQEDFVVNKLDEFIEIQTLSQAVEAAADSLHAGDVSAAKEALDKARMLTKSGDIRENSAWLSDPVAWTAFKDKKEAENFTSGIDILDENGVIPARKEMFLLIGPAKAGKSFWLQQASVANIMQYYKNVLHITLENSLEVVEQRYTQSLLSITTEAERTLRIPIFQRVGNHFTKIDFVQATVERLVDVSRSTLIKKLTPYGKRGRLHVKWFPSGTLTVSQIDAYMDFLEREEGFTADVVVVDYPDLMNIDARDLRIGTGRLFRDLRGLAGRRNAAMLVVTQGNRQSATAKTVTANLVAEDWSKIGTADTIITICQTPQEKDNNLCRILVAAARNARDKWLALITQSLTMGQFCLDSVYMSKFVESQVIRVTTGEDVEDE